MDKLDVRIFREFVQDRASYPFQSDIKKSIIAVASRLDVDRSTVRDHIRRLHKSKIMNEWHVFPNPKLLGLALAYCRYDVPLHSPKGDAIEKIKLIHGVWTIVDHFGNSLRVILFYEDQQSLRNQVELIARILGSQSHVHHEILFPASDLNLTKMDWQIIKSIEKNPAKSYEAMSRELNLSNKTVQRRLKRMIHGRALFTMPSIPPESIMGAMLAEILVVFRGPEAERESVGKIRSYLDDSLLSAQLGDSEHALFLILVRNITETRKISEWLKQQIGVKSLYLDIIQERIDLYDTPARQLEKKLASA